MLAKNGSDETLKKICQMLHEIYEIRAVPKRANLVEIEKSANWIVQYSICNLHAKNRVGYCRERALNTGREWCLNKTIAPYLQPSHLRARRSHDTDNVARRDFLAVVLEILRVNRPPNSPDDWIGTDLSLEENTPSTYLLRYRRNLMVRIARLDLMLQPLVIPWIGHYLQTLKNN